MSTILIRGEFTQDELARFVAVLQGIEAASPDETYEIYIDDPESTTAMEEFLEKVSPLRKGYERVVRYRHAKPRGKS